MRLAVRDAGVAAAVIVCDLRGGDQVRTMVERAAGAFGALDVLVNNAGRRVLRGRGDADHAGGAAPQLAHAREHLTTDAQRVLLVEVDADCASPDVDVGESDVDDLGQALRAFVG